MKTSIKIILLVVFCIVAIAGVLVFAKTRVAPPSNVKQINQYTIALDKETPGLDNISDFDDCKLEYLKLEDRLSRFVKENVIETGAADKYLSVINASYGNKLSDYGFGLFKKSVWNSDEISAMLTDVDALSSSKLSTGASAVNKEFMSTASQLHSIDDEYRAALRLSNNSSFTSIADASSKISKAKNYASQDYLKNNAALVDALNVLPQKLAQGHYNHISGLVSSLGRYYTVSKDYYENTLINRVESAIKEYKKANIYGSNKPSIAVLESRAGNLVSAAMDYYYR